MERAYMKWSNEEIKNLRVEFDNFILQSSRAHQRTMGAIKSRLLKLIIIKKESREIGINCDMEEEELTRWMIPGYE